MNGVGDFNLGEWSVTGDENLLYSSIWADMYVYHYHYQDSLIRALPSSSSPLQHTSKKTMFRQPLPLSVHSYRPIPSTPLGSSRLSASLAADLDLDGPIPYEFTLRQVQITRISLRSLILLLSEKNVVGGEEVRDVPGRRAETVMAGG